MKKRRKDSRPLDWLFFCPPGSQETKGWPQLVGTFLFLFLTIFIFNYLSIDKYPYATQNVIFAPAEQTLKSLKALKFGVGTKMYGRLEKPERNVFSICLIYSNVSVCTDNFQKLGKADQDKLNYTSGLNKSLQNERLCTDWCHICF